MRFAGIKCAAHAASALSHGRKTNHVRGDGSFSRKRSPDAGGGCFNAALASPVMKARLADHDGVALGGPPDDFGKLIADETEKWGKVIRAANIKPE